MSVNILHPVTGKIKRKDLLVIITALSEFEGTELTKTNAVTITSTFNSDLTIFLIHHKVVGWQKLPAGEIYVLARLAVLFAQGPVERALRFSPR